jgi:hypothetical protein
METGVTKFSVGQKVVINDDQSTYHKTHGVIDEINNGSNGLMPTYRVLLGAPATPYWYIERLLEAVEETEEPSISSLADKLPVLTDEIRKEESGDYTAFREKIDTSFSGTQTATLPIWMAEGFNGTLNLASTPKTVGDLMWQYMMVTKRHNNFQRFLEDMNERMNQYADSAGLCSAYDEAVEELNDVFKVYLPDFPFRFSGRSYQYAVTVQRHRTILETAVVYVEGPKDASLGELDYDATDQASHLMDDEWEIVDEGYDYGDIEAIDHSIQD